MTKLDCCLCAYACACYVCECCSCICQYHPILVCVSRRLARVEQATSQVLDAVARLEQRLQQQPAAQQYASASPAPNLPQLLPELQEPAALSNLLSALERVERQERDIHSRWFGSGSSSGAAVNGVSSSSNAGTLGPSAEASNDSGYGAAAQAPAQAAVTSAVGQESTSSKQVRESRSPPCTASTMHALVPPTTVRAPYYSMVQRRSPCFAHCAEAA
jgi:hypothetical protein